MSKRATATLRLLPLPFLLIIATLFTISINIPEAQAGTVTYTWNDDTSTVNITNSGTASTVAWLTLRTQDRAGVKAHRIHPRVEVSGNTWETSPLGYSFPPETVVRPLDDQAIILIVEVANLTVAGNLTLTGTDWRGVSLAETLTLDSDGTYNTIGRFRTLTDIADDGTLTCVYQIWQNRWGIFGYNMGYPPYLTQYILQGNIIINNGITFTPVATPVLSYTLLLRIATGDTSDMTVNFITVKSGGTCLLGRLYDLGTKSVAHGVLVESGSIDYAIFNDGGTLGLYGTHISRCTVRSSSGVSRAWGATFNAMGGIIGDDWDIENCIATAVSASMEFIDCVSTEFNGTIDRVTCLGVGIAVLSSYFQSEDIVVSNLYAKQNTYVYYHSIESSPSYFNVNLTDCYFDAWHFYFITWHGKVYRMYSFDLSTTAGANVRITYDGQGGGTVFDGVVEDGTLDTLTLIKGFYNSTNDDTIYSFEPYHLTISKDGYKTYEAEFTISEKTAWDIELQLDSFDPTWFLIGSIAGLVICIPLMPLILRRRHNGE